MLKYLLIIISFLLYSCAVSSPSSMKSSSKPTPIKKTADTSTIESKKQINKPTNNTKKTDNKSVTKKEDKQETPPPQKPKVRFEDTTRIEMEPIYALKPSQETSNKSSKNPIDKEIELANQLLEHGETEKAREKFSILSSTLPYGDSLYYEAKFGEIECLIAQNNIVQAKKLLQELNKDKGINAETEEKTLVRLGQIECIQNNQPEAETYFNQLKNKYPRSIYLKVANCNFLKKK